MFGFRSFLLLAPVLVLGVLPPTPSSATTIDAEWTFLGDLGEDEGKLFEITYTVTGFNPVEAAGFDLYFDPFLYSVISFLVSQPAGWDVLEFQPDPNLPADGVLDAIWIGAPPSGGVFGVEVVLLGAGVPGAQQFEVFDETFSVIESGAAISTPEPSSLALVGLGLALLAARPRGARAWRRGAGRGVVAAGGTLAVALLSGCPPEQTRPTAGPVVHEAHAATFAIRYSQVASRRASRTVYEYEFQATIENLSVSDLPALLRVESLDPETTLLDPSIDFGVVAAGTEVDGGGDTFTISQNRLAPFDPAALVFLIAPTTALGRCREYLFVLEDVVGGAPHCDQAVLDDPDRGEARFLRALVRLSLPNEAQVDGPDPLDFVDSVKEMEDRFGLSVEDRSLYALSPSLPRDPAGEVALPEDSPDGSDAQAFAAAVLLPALDGAIADLQAFPQDDAFLLGRGDLVEVEAIVDRSAPGRSLRGGDGISIKALAIEIDVGDARLLEAALQLARGKLLLALSLDVEIDLDDLAALDRAIAVQTDLILARPLLFEPGPDSSLRRAQANASLGASIDAYFAASTSIRNEVDAQDDDLITIEPEWLEEEGEIRTHLGDLRESLVGSRRVLDEATVFIDEARALAALNRKLGTAFDSGGVLLDLSQLISPAGGSTASFRALLPAFEPDNRVLDGAFPDPTFGGALLPAP